MNNGYSNAGYSNNGYYPQENDDMSTRHTVHIDPAYDQSLQGAMPDGQSRMHGDYEEKPIYNNQPQYQQPRQQPQSSYQQPQYQQQYQQQQRQQPQQRQSSPQNVMPVNRAGYSPQYRTDSLPPLTQDELRMAKTIPMYDIHSNLLSEPERIHMYQMDVARMKNGR